MQDITRQPTRPPAPAPSPAPGYGSAAAAASDRSILPATAMLALLAVAGASLVGCAAPGAAQPTAPATPAATPTPAPEVEPHGSSFTTQNGTASFDLPAGWSIADQSAVLPNHDGASQWMNQVGLLDADGRELLRYVDGSVSDAGWADPTWEVLEALPIAGGLHGLELAATTWWLTADGQPPRVFAAVAQPAGDEPPYAIFREADGRNGIFQADLAQLDLCADVPDVASAEACLGGDEVRALLDVLASLELHDVPWDAMPAGATVAPSPSAATSESAWTFETHDGSLRVDLPAGWTADETVRGAPDPVAFPLGSDFVTFVSPSGTRLEFSDRSGDDAAIVYTESEEVERRATPSGQLAIAGWGWSADGVTAWVELGADDGPVLQQSTGRNLSLWLADVPGFSTADEARAFLSGPAAQEALDVISTAVVRS